MAVVRFTNPAYQFLEINNLEQFKLKTIGLLGGMSWESTVEYYRALNQGVKQKLGGLHSAKIVLHSVDFGPIERLMQQGDWDKIASSLCLAAKSLENAGADFLLICTNTMHKLAPEIERSINIPLLHIADAAAEVLLLKKKKKVALLGTAFTMEQDFYREKLEVKYGLDVIIPEKSDREIVHNIIFNELCRGEILQSSAEKYLHIMQSLMAQGAEGIILGCTEIGLLVNQNDIQVELFDTTAIHANKAVQMALVD